MSSHDTLRVESHTASAATHALVIAQTSDLVLQACGLGSTQSSDQFSRIQQGESLPRRRGRPQQVSWTQVWSSLLLCALQGMHSFADWRRLLGLQEVRPVCPYLAHTQWPGQTAPLCWPSSLARRVGGYQCATGPNRFPDGTRNARRLCH
jgi:hypothetical protein